MRFEELKKNGTYVGEADFSHNGVYAGTDYFYLLDGDLYKRHEPTNGFDYDGRTETILYIANIKADLKQYNAAYFHNCTDITETVYNNLCNELGITPEQW